MLRFAAQADRDDWNDEQAWSVYYREVSEAVGSRDELDQFDLVKRAFLDGVTVGRTRRG